MGQTLEYSHLVLAVCYIACRGTSSSTQFEAKLVNILNLLNARELPVAGECVESPDFPRNAA